MDFDIFEDLDDMPDENDQPVVRFPKRYVRNGRNPLDFYNNVEFKKRYRSSKELVQHTLFASGYK